MKTNVKKLLTLLLTLAMVLPMVLPVVNVAATEAAGESEQQYAYVAEFSDSTEGVEGLPEGWVAHPSFKNGVITQKEGALYVSTKDTSGVFSAFYEQDEYTDYLIEADFTMLDKTDNNRWMGFTYRANSDDAGTNIFAVKYSNVAVFHSYYTTAITGYDGTTASKAWNTFKQTTFSSSNYPELVNAAQTTVNLKLKVVGENLTAYVNDVKVLETAIHNNTQAAGSFGISTAMANIKVENFKVTNLTPEEDLSQYAYVDNFSESTEGVAELPEGWVRHPNYKNGTITQKDGALYFDTKGASGVCAVFYDQDEYTDYLVEADFTMLDRTDNNRWMGIAYRTNSDETSINTFDVKYCNVAIVQSYYASAITGYDGSVLSKGWKTFKQTTFSSTNYPELVNAPQTTVNLKLSVVGNQLTAYVNDIKVLETTTHNATQELGSFGIVTANANIKVENFKVIDLTEAIAEKDVYAYKAEFAQAATTGLPTGWKQHPNYKAGTFSQNNGAFYFTSKTGSGVGSVYYDQAMYHDYLVEADFTMEDKTDKNRWMGITYRMNGNENSTNMFAIKFNNTAVFQAYYGVAVEGYDGSTLDRGWAPVDGTYFAQDAKLSANYPELAGAGETKVNLKIAIVGGRFYGFVNNIKVLETKIHNAHQALGSFGVATANADIKVENYRAIDLTELNNAAGTSVAHGFTLPASTNGKLLAQAELGNYMASTTVAFGEKDASTAKILVAKSGSTELYVNVQKNGAVTVTKGNQTLFTGTAAIADTANAVIQTVYANGAVRILVDGAEVGHGFALANLPGKYGYVLDGSTTVNAVVLNETTTNVSSTCVKSELGEIEYGATPDWSKVSLICQLSDGTVYQPAIVADMISGFEPCTSGTQTVTLTYQHGGKTYTEEFSVLVKEEPIKNWVAQVGTESYETVAEAIAVANGAIVTMLMDSDEAISINSNVIIDLAGHTLSDVTVADDVTLGLIDSATDNYEDEYGSAAVNGAVKTFAEVNGKNYMVVSNDGVYSAHCYDVAITHISLNPAQDALGYKAKLYGDAVVQSHVQNFGFNLWVDGGNTKTFGKTGTDVVTLRLQNILACNGGEKNINATAFVTLAVGEETNIKTGSQQTTTMKDTLQMVNAAWADYSEAQQNFVKALCDKFAVTKNWELSNIYPEA